jgi:stage II sporulation protein D
MRFSINGNGPEDKSVYVNDASTRLKELNGVTVLTASGISVLDSESYTVLSSTGTTTVAGSGSDKPSSNKGVFVIEGKGSGHNLGMSQRGARAMAEAGYTYEEILKFYYTGITIE